jgi:hypothetical protein
LAEQDTLNVLVVGSSPTRVIVPSQLTNHPIPSTLFLRPSLGEQPMKQCNHCGQWKEEEEFSWRYKALGIRQGACKVCKARQDKKWYSRRKPEHIKNSNTQRQLRIQEAREYVWNYLSTHPCVDCGETDPVVLEFDHVKGKKRKSISVLMGQGYSLDVIRQEIEKCVVRCANCHRRKTFDDMGWWTGM